MNKLLRKQAAARVLQRKNTDLGWPSKAAIPVERKKAIKAGGYRIGMRSDRKRFGKSSGKSHYGHFSGRTRFHMTKRDHQERAEIRSHDISDSSA